MARQLENKDTFNVWKIKINELMSGSVVGSFDEDDTLRQEELVANPWDTSAITYENLSTDLSSEESFPSSIFFKDDGTKMYMSGVMTDFLYQYSLSTAWDISTATYDNVSIDVSSLSNNTFSLWFKPDGTKMYIVDNGATDNVYQYTLSTAWDLSTATYDSVLFDLSGQDSGPTSIFFKDDGIKMYILGSGNESVYQYTLSTAWDISTASYDSVSFSIATEETTPTGLFFKSDGTRMYMVGFDNDTLHQYTLSTAWDISTLSYDNVSFDFTGQDSTPQEIFFKPDGATMYLVGSGTDSVHQYTLISDEPTVVIKSGKLRLGSNVLDVSGKSFTIPLSDISYLVLYTDPDISELRLYQDGSVPEQYVIPLFKVTTDASGITDVEDLRTWVDLSGSANDTDSGILTFSQNIEYDRDIPEGKNALSIDPTIEPGVTVTVHPDSTWVIL